MDTLNKEILLKEIPLFSGLSQEDFLFIQEKCDFVEYKKGQVIYRENDPPSAFYYLILGRVIIYTKDQLENETILEYLHRGKYFGIISLLTGDAHSVTARAMNDCLILQIKDEDFSVILKKVPSIAIDLSQTLSRRLKRKSLHQKTIFESTIISVFSFYPQKGTSTYCLNLALSLHKETRKSIALIEILLKGKSPSLLPRLSIPEPHCILELADEAFSVQEVKQAMAKDQHGIEVLSLRVDIENETYLSRLVDILSHLTNDYHYIVLDLPAAMDAAAYRILYQSDLVHVLVSPDPSDINKTKGLVEKLKTEYHFQDEKIKLVINEKDSGKTALEEQSAALDHPVFATLPKMEANKDHRLILDAPASDYSKAIRRIARREGDCQVGLALGVGVAYGFCHIGVLKVIEEEHIPIDIVVGSSIGAVIAGLWATGRSSQEILQITKEFREPKHVWELIDVTFPLLGFLKGNKLYQFLKRHFGNKTFQDVKVPLRIVASDIKRKESRVLEKGLLADAIMASCSMPGVFLPFKIREEMLFDGGVIYPVPTEPLFELGVKKIIAINVTPSQDDIQKQFEKIKHGKEPVDTPKKKFWNFHAFLRDKLKSNILDVIFSSFEIMQAEVAKKEGQLADVVIHPDMSGLHWLEFQKAEEFAKRGEEAIRRKIDKIWQVINE